MNIGIAGTGRMGSAIAQRLIDSGYAVTAWNRTSGKGKAAQAAGATLVASVSALVQRCELILTILTDARAIDAVYREPGGLLSGKVDGKLFIEMSTVRPATQRALAAELEERGAQLVECPVGGTVGPAREGKLIGLVGADAAAFERARPVLEQLCRRIERCGPIGAGATMKLAINLPLIVFWEAFGEAMALARPLGIDPARLVDLFADTAGGANVLKNRAAQVAKALAGEDTGPATFDLEAMRKDLRTMIEEARERGFERPPPPSHLPHSTRPRPRARAASTAFAFRPMSSNAALLSEALELLHHIRGARPCNLIRRILELLPHQSGRYVVILQKHNVLALWRSSRPTRRQAFR